MQGDKTILYYVHDPMCGWCWGYKPTFEKLIHQLPASLILEYIVGGLAPDNDEPMPQVLREAISGYWRQIQDMLGTEFNFDFWSECEPRRSTYPACRAVLAAKQQGYEVKMIEAIQHAYYLRVMNPSDKDTHIVLADELGLNVEQFKQDYHSDEIESLLQQQVQFARSLPIQGFPSLVLQKNKQYHAIPLNYKNASSSLAVIKRYV